MRSLDKVSEAYYGSMGESFARKTRERIHWICSKARGNHVLDIGCSQGITAVLLAREGKQVIGIDIEEEAIRYAKESLQNESESVKNNVMYQACSIFDFDSEKQFDTIILSEVLEHFADSSSLLQVIRDNLAAQGTLVVTVPFGINDYIDHKKTYYLVNLLDEIEPFFQVTDVRYFGKWIGIVAVNPTAKSDENQSIFSRPLIGELEKQYYQLERNLIDDVALKTKRLDELNKQLSEYKAGQERLKQSIQEKTNITNQIQSQVSDLSQRVETYQSELNLSKKQKEELLQANQELGKKLDQREVKLEEQNRKYEILLEDYKELEMKYTAVVNKYEELKEVKDELKYQNKQIKDRYKEIESEYVDPTEVDEIKEYYDQKIEEMEQIVGQKNKEILQRLESEEETLKKYKNAVFQYNQLEAKFAQVSNKYKLLSNAKLGRLTLKYWKMRKRIPEDF